MTCGASVNAERRHRAGGDAGAAARAGVRVDFDHGWPTQARAEADRTHRAMVAADAAFHTSQREAVVGNLGFDRPGFAAVAAQGAVLADSNAGSAKAAFPAFEIDLRKTAHDEDDLCRTGRNAVAAARTTVDERLFRQRPGRALRSAAGLEITPQELSTTDQDWQKWKRRTGFCLRTAVRASTPIIDSASCSRAGNRSRISATRLAASHQSPEFRP